LNRLRGLRNAIGHKGRCEAQTHRDAAEHLTARNLSTKMRQRWFEFSESPRRRATSAWVG
jgi:hypothetical protein